MAERTQTPPAISAAAAAAAAPPPNVAKPLGPLPLAGTWTPPYRLPGVPPEVEIVPGFGADGAPTGMVYARADIMSPEKSGVYGQSGNLFLVQEAFGLAPLYAVAVRSRTKAVWPLGLDYTASGMSDIGESELDTVVREAREELGFEFRSDRLTRIASWVPRDGFWSRGAVFTARWFGDLIPFNPADIEEIRWMSAAELRAAARRGDPMKSDMRNFLLSSLWLPQ